MQIDMVVTCCIGALPYVRTTLFLPVLLVVHTYPIAFLGGIRPEYDIILRRFRGHVIPDIHDYPADDTDDWDNVGNDQAPPPQDTTTPPAPPAPPSPDDGDRYRKSWD